MKRIFIIGFICGAVTFGTVGAIANNYLATKNIFPVQLNGEDVNIDGYNVDGYSYFKLRDISDIVGGFSVDFVENKIQIHKDDTVQDITFDNETISKNTLEIARNHVAVITGFETASLLAEDDNYWYFAPCDAEYIDSMRDSGGHVSPATIVYQVDKAKGLCIRVQ